MPGIIGGAIHQRIDGGVEIGVLHHITGVLAAEFKTEAGESAGSGTLDGAAAFHRTGEVDEIEQPFGNQRRGRGMVEEDIDEDIVRHTGLDESPHHALADQQRLRRVLDNNRIAGHQGRRDGVNRRHVGVVPRGDDEDHAMRLTLDAAFEIAALLDDERCQCICRDGSDIVGALVETLELAAITNRTAHHMRQLRHNFGHHFVKARHAFQNQLNAVLKRTSRPVLLRLARFRNGGARRFQRHRLPFGINRAVDGRDILDHGHDVFP
ncbi:hypothetical protein D3C78_1039000 [compost metagenome]